MADEFVDLGSDQELFHTFLVKRAELKEREELVKKGVEELKEEAVPMFLAHGIKTFKEEGLGTLSMVEGTNKSIAQDRLRKELLSRQFSAADVAEILEKVTKVSTYITLQFIPWKG